MEAIDPYTALYTAEQARALDRAAMDGDVEGFDLMQRAAAAALTHLRKRWPDARSICVICGPGNNGGDGFLLAALTPEAGIRAEVIALGESTQEDARRARARCEQVGIPVSNAPELPDADVYIDALFGSGLNRAIDGEAAALIRALNAQARPVMALDVPSGLSADTGAAFDPCVRAQATLCFVGWKRGLFTAQGLDRAGERELATLDLPAEAYS